MDKKDIESLLQEHATKSREVAAKIAAEPPVNQTAIHFKMPEPVDPDLRRIRAQIVDVAEAH
jgi:hypothetical protein